jgi:hypothetical protein
VNSPYRGGKATFFEGGLRVPIALQWPKEISNADGKAVIYSETVSHMDISATILAAARSSHLSVNPLDGVNLVPFVQQHLTQSNPTIEEIIPLPLVKAKSIIASNESQFQSDSNSVPHRVLFWRTGHYKSLRMDNWKLQLSMRPQKIWFYDLSVDPFEWNNIANSIDPNSIQLVTEGYSLSNAVCSIDKVCDYGSAREKCINEVGSINSSVYLCEAISILFQMDREEMVSPLWPALSESPVSVDHSSIISLDEEYVYWPN